VRFRHTITIDVARCADAAFRLVRDLNRLAEWHPELDLPEITADRAGGVGHTVRVRQGDQTFTITLTALDAEARTAHIAYSLGFTLEWTVQDYGDAGALVRVQADVANLAPGRPETEEFRGALLRDLELLKQAIERV